MKPFAEQIETLMELGYGQAAAQAKVAHDAVLLAIEPEKATAKIIRFLEAL